MIDNYDSFTYNLVHLFEELGAEVVTVRNDAITVEQAVDGALRPAGRLPRSRPARSSRRLDRDHPGARPTTPTLGVCLGHQAIVEAFGGRIGQAKALLHGKASTITHDGEGVYAGLPPEVAVGRYHSLSAHEVPDGLEVTARTDDGEVMGVRHHELPIEGVQFHPESVLTPLGPADGEELHGPVMIDAAVDRRSRRSRPRAGRRPCSDGLVMAGEATEAQIADLLVALHDKGETADEIAGFAEAMREHVVPVRPQRAPIVDIVGTGGDGAHTFNISTAAALVAAAAGAAVAKHGNRAASSLCGSADVLEELGIALEQRPERIAQSIDELGFGFMFARAHHPAMRHAAAVRQQLGTRTVFNILGPLANPAGACDGVFGVYSADLARTYAEALASLGARHAFVVHGEGGIDELTPSGTNLVVEVVDGDVREWELDPRDARHLPQRSRRPARGLTCRERGDDASRARGRSGRATGRRAA